MDRRTLLVALGSSVGGGVLVYETFASDTSSDESEECQVSNHTLSVERISPTVDQQEHIVPIEFGSLEGAVRDVFGAAIDGEIVRACPQKDVTRTPESALLDALQLVRTAKQRQREQYDDASAVPDWIQSTAYLRREEAFYAIAGSISDDGVSGGPTPPNSTTT